MKKMLSINPKLNIVTTLKLRIDQYKKYYIDENIILTINQHLDDYETMWNQIAFSINGFSVN